MRLLRTGSALTAAALAVSALCGVAAAADGDTARGGGIELGAAGRLVEVQPSARRRPTPAATWPAIGTDGVHAIDTDWQITSYHHPADARADRRRDRVARPDRREPVLPLSGLKLRRGTFHAPGTAVPCGPGDATRCRDYQVNVMVGDRASAETIDAALDATSLLDLGAASRLIRAEQDRPSARRA